MKIHAYMVARRGPREIESVAARLDKTDLKDRFVGDGGVRLEKAALIKGLLFMDFARERGGHGPGLMSRAAPLQDIQLQAGQNFGEDTAMVIHVASGSAAIQYNHFGPRAGSIEDYLTAYDISLGGLPPAPSGVSDWDRYGFGFGATLRPDAYARLAKFGIIHEIDFTIALPGATSALLQAGISLGSVLQAPLPGGIGSVRIAMKATPGRDTRLAPHPAMRVIGALQALGSGVEKAFVHGKPTEEDRLERIDLVKERLSVTASIGLGKGRRYTRQDRWGALAEVLHDWLKAGAVG